MRYSVTTPAAAEPVSLAEAKAHLRVDNVDSDTYISTLLASAREYVERQTGLVLMSQTLTGYQDEFPATDFFWLWPCPVTSVTSLAYFTSGATETAIAATVYALDSTSLPARIYLKEGQSWPTDVRPYNALKCVWAAGYASAAAVPYDLKHAIKLLTSHWFELREPVNIGNISTELALMVKPLIAPYRIGATLIW